MSDGWGDASGIEGNYEDDETNQTSETNEKGETKETKETSETRTTNIKEEWNGRTIYVPDDLLEGLEDAYLETQLALRKEGVSEFRKNRHFYPLLVQFGVEALTDADTDEIRSRLAELDG